MSKQKIDALIKQNQQVHQTLIGTNVMLASCREREEAKHYDKMDKITTAIKLLNNLKITGKLLEESMAGIENMSEADIQRENLDFELMSKKLNNLQNQAQNIIKIISQLHQTI